MIQKCHGFKDSLCNFCAKVQLFFETTKYFVYFLRIFVYFLRKMGVFGKYMKYIGKNALNLHMSYRRTLPWLNASQSPRTPIPP